MRIVTEDDFGRRYDFCCEKRLSQTDRYLHRCFRNSVFSIDLLLANYKNIFPFFTDHTFEHSEQVINYCNIVAGEDIIGELSPDEIYILLMGATLHDVGMGISSSDFEQLSCAVPELISYIEEHPGQPLGEYTRLFHQELSAQFIKKYSALFEIPSDEYVYCISQVARGHRKANLLDESGFPHDYLLKNGKKVNLAYITALVKLADELDVTASRNLLFNYNTVDEKWSKKQTMCYKCHGAIKKLEARDGELILYYDTKEPEVEQEILQTRSKVDHTFAEYREVVEKRTSFDNGIKNIIFKNSAVG